MLLTEVLNEFQIRNIERGINDYQSALRFIQENGRGGKRAKLPSVQSFLVLHEDGAISVFYHDTAVVTYYEDGAVTLDTGGWLTKSTQTMMNGYLPRGISVRFKVPRKGGEEQAWVYTNDHQHEWNSTRCVITADGHFVEER